MNLLDLKRGNIIVSLLTLFMLGVSLVVPLVDKRMLHINKAENDIVDLSHSWEYFNDTSIPEHWDIYDDWTTLINAHDGDDTTRALSRDPNAAVQFRTNVRTVLTYGIRINVGDYFGASRRWVINISDDNSSWTILWDGMLSQGIHHLNFTYPSEVVDGGRYVRVTPCFPVKTTMVYLYEISFINTEDDEPEFYDSFYYNRPSGNVYGLHPNITGYTKDAAGTELDNATCEVWLQGVSNGTWWMVYQNASDEPVSNYSYSGNYFASYFTQFTYKISQYDTWNQTVFGSRFRNNTYNFRIIPRTYQPFSFNVSFSNTSVRQWQRDSEFNVSFSNSTQTCPSSSNENPSNGSTDVSIDVGFWNITIEDIDGQNTSGSIEIIPSPHNIGEIEDDVIDTWEWDSEEGRVWNPASLIKLGNSEYYMISAYGDTGTDNDGFLRTFQVNNSDGKFTTKNLISKWEYDDSDGAYAGITHISGDIYAIYHMNATAGALFTTCAWSSNGTLKENIIDIESMQKKPSSYPSLIHVTDDIYALMYQEYGGDYDQYLETFEISSYGAITPKDVQLIDDKSITTVINSIHGCMVDSDTIAIVWSESVDYNLSLVTYNITSSGEITNTNADLWVFYLQATSNAHAYIHEVTDNMFAINYKDKNLHGQMNITSIADNGSITKSFIDTFEFESTTCFYPLMYTMREPTIDENGVFFIGYQNASYHVVKTLNISKSGIIDGVIDTSNFESGSYFSPFTHISNDYYLIISTEIGIPYGNSYVIEMETDYLWTNQPNGTQSLHLDTLDYDTNYIVWVNYTDGACEVSEWFWFITESEAPPREWSQIELFNMSFSNTTVVRPTFSFNVSFENTSLCHETFSFNFSFSNISNYKQTTFWNVSFCNTSDRAWKRAYSFNVSFENVSLFKQTSYWNISFENTSDISNVFEFNVSFMNTSGYQTPFLFNVSFSNTSEQNWNQTSLFNVSFSNTSAQDQIMFWNVSFSNLSSFNTKSFFNISFSNTSHDRRVYSFNVSFSNETDQVWNRTSQWLVSFSNTSLFKQPFLFNVSFSNTSKSITVSTFNISFRNTTSYRDVYSFNVSFSNTSDQVWNETFQWVISFSNTSLFKRASLFDVSFSNTSYILTTFSYNISFSNISSIKETFSYNISFSNTSDQNWNQTDLFNISFSNSSSMTQTSLWNISFSNASSFETLFWFNISFGNTSLYKQTMFWNVSFCNVSDQAFNRTFLFNISFSNTSLIKQTNYWNISFSNTSILSSVYEFNISFSNSTQHQRIFSFNVSFCNISDQEYNRTMYHVVSFSNTTENKRTNYWNVSFSNTSTSVTIFEFNVSFSNTSYNNRAFTFNISFSNASDQQWNITQFFNFSFSNTSDFIQTGYWNISFSNSSVMSTISQFNVSFSNTSDNKESFQFNVSFSNQSDQNWNQTHYFNISFSNYSHDKQVELWNISFSNSSVLEFAFMFNISFSNTSQQYRVSSWNMSFSNTSDQQWNETFIFNMSFGNTSSMITPFIYNVSFSNSSVMFVVFEFNMSFSNSTTYNQENYWNISFSNVSDQQWNETTLFNFSFSNTTMISETLLFNVSFSNASSLQTTFTYNISFGNITDDVEVFQFNFSFSNSTFDIWTQTAYFNISFSNTSSHIGIEYWVISFSNSSGPLILITSEFPTNGSEDLCPPFIKLGITVDHAENKTMNLTFYSNLTGGAWDYFCIEDTGTHYTITNVTDGTYYFKPVFFCIYNQTYFWNVSVFDGINFTESSIFHFTTSATVCTEGEGTSFNTSIIGVVGCIGILGFVLELRRRKRRR